MKETIIVTIICYKTKAWHVCKEKDLFKNLFKNKLFSLCSGLQGEMRIAGLSWISLSTLNKETLITGDYLNIFNPFME